MNYVFAIPVKEDVISDHFGRAKEYCFITVVDREIKSMNRFTNPVHEYAKIPRWLSENKVTHVFANGIGQRAIEILNTYNIEVLWGLPEDKPEHLVKAYLDSQLTPGVNLCDH